MATKIPSLRAATELVKLGRDIAIARKRRRFTQQRLAEGAGVNVATLRRLEKGDAGVSVGVLAMVLLTLGESGRIADLLDIAKDDIGLALSVSELPQRIRAKRLPKSEQGDVRAEATSNSTNPAPEAF
jgi:transcriptional regulator with XRE-family HTH domain